MISYCEYCKKKTLQIVVKNKRSKDIRAYCWDCQNLLRINNAVDKEELKIMTRR